MTHGVFAGAIRDGLVFTALIVGGPLALGIGWNLVCRIAGEIRRAARRKKHKVAGCARGIPPHPPLRGTFPSRGRHYKAGIRSYGMAVRRKEA